ncbi:MAG TPA: type IV toxin-antitoxin system AbiEi family antitoxin domain-containing protein [Bacilli bacterium]|nr:type IV toxin-antitoxin system AbiEi family antitoxin domain-containing protein [Bacilli bacterium]
MNQKDNLINIIKSNGGYITAKEIEKENINRYYLMLLIKEGNVIRISRGYYSLKNSFADNFYIILSKSKKSVFSDATALYFHNLSDRNPTVYDITIPYGYGNSYKNENNVNLHYVKKELLDLGLIEIKSPFGMKIRVYDIERTICDIIRNKNKMDSEIFVNALKGYSKLVSKDINRLMRYAKLLKVEKKVREYMEVLI